MRVLWAASSQPGSLFPAVPIAKELVRRGHHVTAVSDAGSESTFRNLGFDFTPTRRVDALPPPARPLTRAAKAAWWRDNIVAMFADVTATLDQASYDVVLADPLETGADFAAETAGIPYASYVHWGLDECGADVPFCFHLWDHETDVDLAFAGWWNELRAQVGLPPERRPAADHRWYRTSPRLTLMLGLPELVHPHGTLPKGTVRVGPTVFDPPATTPLPEWVATLGVQRRAVLATLSTVGSTADLDIVDVLAAATEPLDVDLVMTIPIAHELRALPRHVQVASFLPHNVVLERCAVFVNHAGNGAVNRAAAAGKPALLLPTGRDQFQVARGATAAGFAITLQPDQRDERSVGEALAQLLDAPSFAAQAARLAQSASAYDAARLPPTWSSRSAPRSHFEASSD